MENNTVIALTGDNLNLLAAAPEAILAIGALALLMIGVFRQDIARAQLVHWLTVGLLCFAGIVAYTGGGEPQYAFGGAFVSDGVSRFAKLFIFFGTAITLILSRAYLLRANLMIFEFPVLVALAALGMSMMVSSADLISLYMGLELQSLSLYVLASFRRDSVRSTEAGLKYFVLGALSSGLLLFGMSFVYGAAVSTEFTRIAEVVAEDGRNIGMVIGLAFILAGLAFKISAAPFHMWTPDVYEGAPTPVTAFFATAPKMAAAVLMVRVLYDAFGPSAVPDWQMIVAFLAAASMLVGSIAAIGQTDIKRLMAYSSIAHMGFALVGMAAGTEAGARSVMVYLAVYMVMNLGVFAYILTMRRNGVAMTKISDLAGLWQRDGFSALCLAILMFSLAGIPPLAGFWAKWYTFGAAIAVDDGKLVWLLVVATIAAVISAFYYLRLVKIMVFDDAADGFDGPMGGEFRAVLGLSAAVMVLFVIGGLGITEMAADAATIYAR